MATEQRCSVKLLVFGASLREGSLNARLASLAGRGGGERRVRRARDDVGFRLPPYDSTSSCPGNSPERRLCVTS